MESKPPNRNNLLPTPWLPASHLISSASTALRLNRRLHLGLVVRSSLERISSLAGLPQWKDICKQRAIQFSGSDCFQWSSNALSATLMGLSFFNDDDSKSGSKGMGKSFSGIPKRDLFDKRQWTNVLLAANIVVFVAQTISEGRVLYWGAKVNTLISKGQLWRLATSSFLHADIWHLMVNCYSLNSVGPTMERISGHRRFLTIYIASAISGSAMSYWFCKAPAVGASGAIFGLVGSFAIFTIRHRRIFKGTEDNMKHIAQVIVLNMAIGILSRGIDNWGHVGGLIGGAAVSWFLGPAWEVDSVSWNGAKVLTDNAPIFSIFKRK